MGGRAGGGANGGMGRGFRNSTISSLIAGGMSKKDATEAYNKYKDYTYFFDKSTPQKFASDLAFKVKLDNRRKELAGVPRDWSGKPVFEKK